MTVFEWIALGVLAVIAFTAALMADRADKRADKLADKVEELEILLQKTASRQNWIESDQQRQAKVYADSYTKTAAEMDKLREQLRELIRINTDICRRYVLYRDPIVQNGRETREAPHADADD